MRSLKSSRLPVVQSLPRTSYHREEEVGLREVGVLLEVADGLCPQGLLPTFYQELGVMGLHVSKAPSHNLSEPGESRARGRQNFLIRPGTNWPGSDSLKQARVRNVAVPERASPCPGRGQAAA